MIVDHIGINVKDFEKSKSFYLKALAPLGIGSIMEVMGWAGFGKNGSPDFWFGTKEGQILGPIHIAFAADDRKTVDAFYEAAIAAGGKDNGKPGIRAEYHPNYYGAFVIDPDGNNIEAVCHKPE